MRHNEAIIISKELTNLTNSIGSYLDMINDEEIPVTNGLLTIANS